MRVAEIHAHNFRSLRDLSCTLSDLTVLLGPNNHGKSNILAALEFVLTPGFKLTAHDFFSSRPEGDGDLFVEVVFSNLTDQELRTFRKYVRADGTVRVRRYAEFKDVGSAETGYRGYLQQPTTWWLQGDAFDRLRTMEMLREAAVEAPALGPLIEEGGRVTKDRIAAFQAEYTEEHRDDLDFEEVLEEGPFMGVKNIGGGVLPDFYAIPAVRDLSDETKTTGTSMFGRLLQRAVSEMATSDPRFLTLQNDLHELVAELNERPEGETESELARLETDIEQELSSWDVSVSIKVVAPEVKKLLELGTELWIDDGDETPAERKGHGLQRAILFSLIKAWSAALKRDRPDGQARSRAASESLIFAFEEPELYLHPHAQRTLADALRTIAGAPEHQVLICTHSTHFVNLDEYRSIVVVRRQSREAGTKVRQCTVDLFEGEGPRDRKDRFHMGAWVNPERSELFFARKVVLVEGETEKVILPFLAHKLGVFDQAVSVIDCGSKHNLPLYIRILNAFLMPYSVVHDEDPVPDPVPREWNQDRVGAMRRTFAMNNTIADLVNPALAHVEVLSPDFERSAGVSRNQGDKKGKALAALDHFSAMPADEIPDGLKELVRAVYGPAPEHGPIEPDRGE